MWQTSAGLFGKTARSERQSAFGLSPENFAGNVFEGTFDIFGCAWKMILNMKKP
jgi:hypothetical protein